MIEALKIIFFFEKPSWDDFRFPYIFFGIIGWLEIIAIIHSIFRQNYLNFKSIKGKRNILKSEDTLIIARLAKEWEKHDDLIIACDFDDTICRWSLDADYDSRIEILKKAQELKTTLIIWTATVADRYDFIQDYCKSKGLNIYSINKNKEGLMYGNNGKIYANIFLDDRAGLTQAFQMLEIAMEHRKRQLDSNELEITKVRQLLYYLPTIFLILMQKVISIVCDYSRNRK